MEGFLKISLFASLALVCLSCSPKTPAIGFKNSNYFGLWYEVGKIETRGWSFFYKDCTCTETEIKQIHGNSSGQATASHTCRLNKPTGIAVSKTGILKREGPLGKWKESFDFFTRSIDYTVLYMDDNVALEYDCQAAFGSTTDYCIHFMSRQRTMDDQTLQLLLKVVDELGLNTRDVKFRRTEQKNCPL